METARFFKQDFVVLYSMTVRQVNMETARFFKQDFVVL